MADARAAQAGRRSPAVQGLTREGMPVDPVVFDGGDHSCVRLLLELRAFISGLAGGTVVHVIATDPAAPVDLPAWCHLTGHSYLGAVAAAGRPAYALRTIAVPAATNPANPWHRGAGQP